MSHPVSAQGFKCHVRKNHVTIFTALALVDTQLSALAVNVGYLNIKRFSQAQPHAETGENEGLVADLTGTVNEPLNLLQGGHIG